jgi:hypothetical protein
VVPLYYGKCNRYSILFRRPISYAGLRYFRTAAANCPDWSGGIRTGDWLPLLLEHPPHPPNDKGRESAAKCSALTPSHLETIPAI